MESPQSFNPPQKESVVTGVTQMPQQEEDEDGEDEETGEKFEFDDSEDEHQTEEKNKPGALHVEAELLDSTKGHTDPNALYCQAMKSVTLQEMNGGTPAGLEDQDISMHAHVTRTDTVARRSPDGSSVSAEPRGTEEPANIGKRSNINEGKPVSESEGDSSPEQLQVNTAHSEVIYDDVPCENITSLGADDDVIYEDVQRSGESALIDNGWGSSEFESYDEQSDSETKQPTRNKVQIHNLFK